MYKLTCASCSSSLIGEICCQSKTRIEEHIKKDNKFHIFKHLHSTAICFDSYNYVSYKIVDKANSKFDLKIREPLHINWRKPNLSAQQNHLLSPFHLFLLSLTLITDIFYRLNYTSLLLHLITTHLVSHVSLSSIIFSISALIINTFFCPDCILLLLRLILTHLVIDFIITM